jgi:threonine dehydrogenase-like Zn-dependent dehydrogenase
MKTTRSVVLVAPRKVEMREFPFPEVARDALLVEVEAVGVCGGDARFYAGQTFGPEHPGEFPVILGHETVGRVKDMGEDATESMVIHGGPLKEGDRIVWYPLIPCERCHYCTLQPQSKHLCQNPWVYGWINCERPENRPWIYGGYGEHVYIRPGTHIWKLPPTITLEEAVILDTLVSVRGVERALTPYPNLGEGLGLASTVLVQGDGPVGMCAAAKARLLGANLVIMIGKHWNRLEHAKDFGADFAFNISESDQRIVAKEVFKLTGGLGVDVIVDCTGEPSSLTQGLDMLKRGGTFIEIGCILHKGTVEIDPALQLTAKDLWLIGQYYAPPQQYERDLRLLSSKRMPFHRMLSCRFKLTEAEEALKAHLSRKWLKLMIQPNK